MKSKFDGQQFNQYQQNKQLPLHLNTLRTKKMMTYGNPGPGLVEVQKTSNTLTH
jgi:hypothetical protein